MLAAISLCQGLYRSQDRRNNRENNREQELYRMVCLQPVKMQQGSQLCSSVTGMKKKELSKESS